MVTFNAIKKGLPRRMTAAGAAGVGFLSQRTGKMKGSGLMQWHRGPAECVAHGKKAGFCPERPSHEGNSGQLRAASCEDEEGWT